MSKRVTILKWIFFSLMIVINGFIIYQSCLPSKSSNSWSDVVVIVIQDITGGEVTPSSPVAPGLTFSEFIRKAIGHFVLFGLDGVISYLFFYYLNKEVQFKIKWLHVLFATLVGIVTASLTELIQLFVPGRAGDILDVLLDVGGFVVALSIAFLVVYLINRPKKNREDDIA